MSSKIRKQIYIGLHQEHLLKAMSTTGYAYAQQSGVSVAEIIRQAIYLHFGEITPPQTNLAMWEAEREFIDQIKT